MRMRFGILVSCFLVLRLLGLDVAPPVSVGPVPDQNQYEWQKLEFYAFVHFSLNTYTNKSWGFGDEKLSSFNPSRVNCREWARVCKEAGMKGIIITAKHHGGFCLWPSKYTDYSVKNTPWREGKGDLVREMSDACREYGLKFGVYLSPWDRNRADYGTPSYIQYFRRQLTELLTEYGPVFEVWFDGANGGTGYYGGANEERRIDRSTYYDWANTYALVRKLQPQIVIWNDGGERGDLRWVGTESGYVGETNWSLLNRTGEVSWDMLHHGLEIGDSWVPAEVNTSIRPEWFYHPEEDDKVKSLTQLVDTYYNSIGRNATLLLNFPITPDGEIHEKDQKAVRELARVIGESFKENLALTATVAPSNVRGNDTHYSVSGLLDRDPATYWTTDDGITCATLSFQWKAPVFINRFLVQEAISLGQRVRSFVVEVLSNGEWVPVVHGTTVGYKRILRFPSVLTSGLRLRVLEAKGPPAFSSVGIYNAPALLDAPLITRNQAGEVRISSSDVGPEYHYTTDGTTPSLSSRLFSVPFLCDGRCVVKAIAVDPSSGTSSVSATQTFDVSRRCWKVLAPESVDAAKIIDGDPSSICHTPVVSSPSELTIDLGAELIVSGFNYTPDRAQWGAGVISRYEFLVSLDGEMWRKADGGEFANIKNNPVTQVRRVEPCRARFVRLVALGIVDDASVVGYAEFGVMTE